MRHRAAVDRLDRQLERAQRGVVCAVVVLSAMALWDSLPDPFMLPKITMIVLAAVALMALSGVRALRNARVAVPRGPLTLAAVALGVTLVLATVTADNVALAFVGNHSRYGGLLSYASYLVIMLVSVRVFVVTTVRPVLVALLAAMAVVTTYGLVQVAGLDPYSWSVRRDRPIFSTMGNTNFAGAYVALVLPVAVAAVLLRGWSPAWRIAAAVLAGVSAVYMLATAASQAVLAAAAGVAVVAAAWFLSVRRGRSGRPAAQRPQWVPWAVAAGALTALGALVALALRVASDVADSYAERLQFWQAAVAIAADHPLLGTGLDSFRDHFPSYRPAEHAVDRDYQITDSAHNAVLGMLSNGGVPLALAYVVFVGCTAWLLVRGLRTAAPEQVLPLAALGGSWTAYQVQSMVSVDVPPLALLHFLAAGLIAAVVSPPATWSRALPVSAARHDGLLPRSGAARRPLSVALLAVVVVGALAGMYSGVRPLRADLAAAEARGLQGGKGLPHLDRAVALAPWEAEYRLLQAQARLSSGDRQGAYEAVASAARLRRGSSKLAVGNVDLALKLKDQAAAVRWMELALERDPNNPVVLERAATFFKGTGDAGRAERLEARAAELQARYGET